MPNSTVRMSLNLVKVSESELENMDILDFVQAEDRQEDIKRTGMVKHGTIAPISSMQDVENMLRYSIKTKDKLNLKHGYQGGTNESKSHLVVNLNVRMKDKENPNFPVINSLVQFVRFGGTERMSKSMNHPYKGEKYQESILINSDHTNLAKVVYSIYSGQKTINYDESKLIKMMRLTLNNKSAVTLLTCLNPNEATFEDSLNSLAHLDRCKNFEEGNKEKPQQKKTKESEAKPKQAKPGVRQNQLQQLQEEIQEKKVKIDDLQNDYKRYFDELAKELNLTEDIDKIIHNDNAKEWRRLRDQKMAQEKWASMELFEKQLDKDLAELRREEEKLRLELSQKGQLYK